MDTVPVHQRYNVFARIIKGVVLVQVVETLLDYVTKVKFIKE